jgi:hypothetical protein
LLDNCPGDVVALVHPCVDVLSRMDVIEPRGEILFALRHAVVARVHGDDVEEVDPRVVIRGEGLGDADCTRGVWAASGRHENRRHLLVIRGRRTRDHVAIGTCPDRFDERRAERSARAGRRLGGLDDGSRPVVFVDRTGDDMGSAMSHANDTASRAVRRWQVLERRGQLSAMLVEAGVWEFERGLFGNRHPLHQQDFTGCEFRERGGGIKDNTRGRVLEDRNYDSFGRLPAAARSGIGVGPSVPSGICVHAPGYVLR